MKRKELLKGRDIYLCWKISITAWPSRFFISEMFYFEVSLNLTWFICYHCINIFAEFQLVSLPSLGFFMWIKNTIFFVVILNPYDLIRSGILFFLKVLICIPIFEHGSSYSKNRQKKLGNMPVFFLIKSQTKWEKRTLDPLSRNYVWAWTCVADG